MKILTALFFATAMVAAAQTPEVPHKMDFAGITLTIRDDARREIQKDVDMLTQSPKHFAIKAERAKTYFPIIEKVFADEGVPDDFKYLVLQESALIADAVSTSNAVGFWQFKDFTAMEMGLRVDKDIDERMNIVSASQGAARYIKKNNFYFNNWLYALQAYQMGAGAVLKTSPEGASGASHMEITSKTYWYVKKYLAHKIAFEGAVKGPGQVRVTTYENKSKKTLADLAKEIAVDESQLKTHNKWTKSGRIPDDRTYVVLIPVSGDFANLRLPAAVASSATQAVASKASVSPTASFHGSKTKVNGLLIIVAAEGEIPATLAARANVSVTEFLKWNDISISDRINPGQHYFLAKKRARASEAYHKVLPGENLWSISQQYGVQMKKLRKYNRLETDMLKEGETLWLSSRRPKDAKDVIIAQEVAEVDNDQTFNWDDTPNVATPIVTVAPIISIPDEGGLEKNQEPTDTAKNIQMLPADVKAVDVPEKDSIFTIEVRKAEHIVQAGETLYAIAHEYNLAVMDLVHWNDLNLQEGIKPGQVLKLYEPSEPAASVKPVEEPQEIVHEVRSSDTLYSVARKYGVTIKELMEWNGKKDFNVTVGEKIRILRK